MEAAKTPKYRSFPWRYQQAFAACVRVDAERNFNGLRKEKYRRESHQFSKSLLRDRTWPVSIPSKAIRCGGGSQLSPHELHDTWGPERGRHTL